MLLGLGSYKPYFFCASWLPVRFFSRRHKEGAEGRKETAPCCWFAVPVGVALGMTVRTSGSNTLFQKLLFHFPHPPAQFIHCSRSQEPTWAMAKSPPQRSNSQLCMVPPTCSWETVAARPFSFLGVLDPALQGPFYKPYTILGVDHPNFFPGSLRPGGRQHVLLIFRHLVAHFHK